MQAHKLKCFHILYLVGTKDSFKHLLNIHYTVGKNGSKDE